MSRASRGVLVGGILAVLLVAVAIASATIGQLPIPASEVGASLIRAAWDHTLGLFGLPSPVGPPDPTIEGTLWAIRFPRTATAVVVGASLAIAGAVMQAIFGNPLAEPGVVGISAGGALGAALAIVLGLAAFGAWTTAAVAFAGALGATILVYTVSRAGGRTEVVTLLLTGIAVNAFAGAGLATLIFAADQGSREQIVFWQLGSLNGSRWPEAGIVAVVLVIAGGIALSRSRSYDLLALGERNARHLGVDVEGLRLVSIVLVALLTGAAVAFAGIISFVGLVVPHLIRMLVGPAHFGLLVSSALGGAVLLVGSDLLARTVIVGADLPIGLLTSLIGGPFFFFLLYRQRRRSGGWA